MSTSILHNVMERSVVVVLSLSVLRTRRGVSTDDVEVEADKALIHVAKDILDSEELRAIDNFDAETRRWLRRRCSPSPIIRAGAFLISVDLLPEVFAYLDQRIKDREALVQKFVEVYPTKVKEAKDRLKELFDPTEYPAAQRLASAFKMEYVTVEMNTPKKLSTISKAFYEKEKKKAEREWETATDQVRAALRVSMADLVNHMVERLQSAEDGRLKRFRQSTITNMIEFLDLFEKRNLTNDEELAKLVAQAKKLVNGVEVKELKNDEKAIKQMTDGFTTIKSALDTMIETQPARRMSLADEEV